MSNVTQIVFVPNLGDTTEEQERRSAELLKKVTNFRNFLLDCVKAVNENDVPPFIDVFRAMPEREFLSFIVTLLVEFNATTRDYYKSTKVFELFQHEAESAKDPSSDLSKIYSELIEVFFSQLSGLIDKAEKDATETPDAVLVPNFWEITKIIRKLISGLKHEDKKKFVRYLCLFGGLVLSSTVYQVPPAEKTDT